MVPYELCLKCYSPKKFAVFTQSLPSYNAKRKKLEWPPEERGVDDIVRYIRRKDDDLGKRFAIVNVRMVTMRVDTVDGKQKETEIAAHGCSILFNRHSRQAVFIDPSNHVENAINPDAEESYYENFDQRITKYLEGVFVRVLEKPFNARFTSVTHALRNVNALFAESLPPGTSTLYCVPLAMYAVHALVLYWPFLSETTKLYVIPFERIMNTFIVHYICRGFPNTYPPPRKYMKELFNMNDAMAEQFRVRDSSTMPERALMDSFGVYNEMERHAGKGSDLMRACISEGRPWKSLSRFIRFVLVDFLEGQLRILNDPAIPALDKWTLDPEDSEGKFVPSEPEQDVIFMRVYRNVLT